MMNSEKTKDENRTLKAKDFQNIELVKSGYYWHSGYNEHTLRCKARGKTVELKYSVYRHDEGYGFTIHSDGADIWEAMPEPELEKLENILSNAVAFGEWKKRLEDAKTKEEVQEVRYSLYDEESGKLTGKQIQELHAAIDTKEAVIREGCEKAGMTFSAFIRSKVLEPDRALQRDSEKKKLFRDHIYAINRIGNNVNQVARVVNSKQFASASELKTLTDYLRKIESLEKELMEKLMEE